MSDIASWINEHLENRREMSEKQLCPKCGGELNIFWRDADSRVRQCLNKDCKFEADSDDDFALKKKSIDDDYTIKNLRLMLQNTETRLQSTIARQADLITKLVEDGKRLAEKWVSEDDCVKSGYSCQHCSEESKITNDGWNCIHEADCPITKHAELMKEVRG